MTKIKKSSTTMPLQLAEYSDITIQLWLNCLMREPDVLIHFIVLCRQKNIEHTEQKIFNNMWFREDWGIKRELNYSKVSFDPKEVMIKASLAWFNPCVQDRVLYESTLKNNANSFLTKTETEFELRKLEELVEPQDIIENFEQYRSRLYQFIALLKLNLIISVLYTSCFDSLRLFELQNQRVSIIGIVDAWTSRPVSESDRILVINFLNENLAKELKITSETDYKYNIEKILNTKIKPDYKYQNDVLNTKNITSYNYYCEKILNDQNKKSIDESYPVEEWVAATVVFELLNNIQQDLFIM